MIEAEDIDDMQREMQELRVPDTMVYKLSPQIRFIIEGDNESNLVYSEPYDLIINRKAVGYHPVTFTESSMVVGTPVIFSNEGHLRENMQEVLMHIWKANAVIDQIWGDTDPKLPKACHERRTY